MQKENEKTPLFLAISMGHVGVPKCLINARDNIHAKNNKEETPFYTAVSKGDVFMPAFLLQAGADIYAKDNSGNMPLDHLAVRHGQAAAIPLLKAKDACDIMLYY